MHQSVRRSVLPCVVLVLLVIVPLPALAADHATGWSTGALSQSLSALWGTIVSWVVPSGWVEKLGPDMDPNGFTTGSCPSGGCGVEGGNATDLGPTMDPNG